MALACSNLLSQAGAAAVESAVHRHQNGGAERPCLPKAFPGQSFLSGQGLRNLWLPSQQVAQQSHLGWRTVRAEAASAPARTDASPDIAIDWDTIGFGLRPTDFMYVAKCESAGEWSGELRPFGNLEMSPSAAVLNYGQGVFEGMKANRTEDGRILLFRPSENAARMQEGAARMSMPAPPADLFINAVKKTVAANSRWVPPYGKGSLYIRPLLIGSGAVLGLAPAPEYTFLIYVSPVGPYFKGGQLQPIDLIVEETYHRAAPGGTGGVKSIGNYAPVLHTQLDKKSKGYADVIYLDSVENKYIEEVSSCNIFAVKGRSIVTPSLRGTILPGITRRSIIELATSRGYDVSEKNVSVDEVVDADEVFVTGTAVVVSPVGSVTFRENKTKYKGGEVGPVSQELYKALTDMQTGRSEDTMKWTVEVSF